jgi:16S rRNA (guanine527-N7)-methyltransferase
LIDWCKAVLRKSSTQGLICLKGGDLTEEIKASQLPVTVKSIADIFKEEFFKEKFVLQVK